VTKLGRAGLRPIAAALAVVTAASALAACSPGRSSEAGVVIAVDASAPGQVDGFTLRTEAGEELDFSIGSLELDGGAFPAQHLQEHLVTGEPVAVAFETDGAVRVAKRLVDAPWLRP
jgi:hypothetical protein